MRVGEILEYREGRAARVARPYSPTGDLPRRRALRPPLPATWLTRIAWRFPLFGAGFMRRPFDADIDDR